MKRILFLSGSLMSGGAERQMVTIARLLKDKGYDVEVACYARNNFYAHLLDEKKIKINWQVTDSYLGRIIKIRRFLRNEKYDIVISFLAVPNFLNAFSSIGGSKWKIITGERSAKTSSFTSLKGKIFAYFQRFSTKIVCNSDNAKDLWFRFYPKYKSKLTTIYNIVNLQPITSKYIVKKDNKLHLVIAASFQYLKNPIGLINALSLLNDEEKTQIDVSWYGRTEYSEGDTRAYDEAMNLIKKNKLHDVIHLHEETKDIANKMNNADVVALFSRVEGLPNVICEGMMIGKPIIMSRVSDYSILVDKSNGFLCDWDNIDSIKTSLKSAMSLSPEELLEMGYNSKKKAKNLFSSQTILKKWIEIIEN